MRVLALFRSSLGFLTITFWVVSGGVLFSLAPVHASSSSVRAVVTGKTVAIYLNEGGKMRAVARLAQGDPVIIADKPNGQWVRALIPGGTQWGWVPVRDVAVARDAPAPANSVRNADARPSLRYWEVAVLTGGSAIRNNAILDAAFLESPYIPTLQGGLEGGYFLGRLGLLARVDYLYASCSNCVGSGVSNGYGIKIPAVQALVDYALISKNTVSCGIGAGAGLGLGSLWVDNGVTKLESSWTSLTFLGRANAKWAFSPRFGLMAEVGYRMFFPTAASTAASFGTLNLKGSAFGLSLGVFFRAP